MEGGAGLVLLLLAGLVLRDHVAILDVHLPIDDLRLHAVRRLDQLLALSRQNINSVKLGHQIG